VSRRALSTKNPSAPTPTSVPPLKLTEKSKAGVLQPVPEDGANPNVFSKVFTPKGSPKDVYLDDEREPSPAAPSGSAINVFQAPATTFMPQPPHVVDTSANTKTPFKVFSRPPDPSGKAFTPKSNVFAPFVREEEGPRTVLGERTPSRSPQEDAEDDENHEDGPEEHQEEAIADDESDPHTPETGNGSTYEQSVEPYRVPLGGRFGEFNVMTPITERTYDFTMSTRGMSTPRDEDAVEVAERLAAELRDEEYDGNERLIEVREQAFDSSFASFDEEPARPFRVSDGHTIPVGSLAALEEKTGSLSLVDALTTASSFKPSNPCNPCDPAVISTLLSLIPVNGGFYDLQNQEVKLLDGLQKFAQKRKRQSGNTSSRSIMSDDMCHSLTLAGRRFKVSDKLGEGGFGAVFAAKEVRDDDESFIEDEEDDGSSMVAVKVVKPRNLWEFHILQRVHCALPPHLRQSIVLPHALYAYRDESFLILDLCPQGTLLDIVNRASQAGVSQQGACLDELLVVFFSVELLRLVEGLHTAGFIHGDLKIDNCLLRLEDVPGGAAALSSIYSPSGEQGWSYKGIKLIDFGRTIETKLFPVDQQFVADWSVDAKDCFEMRQNKPWTYQADYYGLAGIIYCLLFGKYIEASSVAMTSQMQVGANPKYKISTPFKRYWQSNIWSNLFDILLNPGSVRVDGRLPLCQELGAARKEMETWLQNNCNRSSGTLKGLLKKIEVSVYSR
jgi:checkpoint serine/threonine-protein kinase